MRLAAALARFVVQLRADGRSSHAVAQYERHVAAFAPRAGTHRLVDVRAIQSEQVAACLGSPSSTHGAGSAVAARRL